jgi:hypothetical protein
MGKDLLNALAYEAGFIGESDMLARKNYNALKQYKNLSTSEIAGRIHSKPGKSVVFALFYEMDEKGTMIEDSLDGWFSISLQDNYERRGKYVLLVEKMGARAGVDVGEKHVGAMPTAEQVLETVQWVFDDFQFGQDSFCVCVQGEELDENKKHI